jgi:hypothetical protein
MLRHLSQIWTMYFSMTPGSGWHHDMALPVGYPTRITNAIYCHVSLDRQQLYTTENWWWKKKWLPSISLLIERITVTYHISHLHLYATVCMTINLHICVRMQPWQDIRKLVCWENL